MGTYRPIRDFADFWGRAGLPADERLHAEIAWTAALEAFATRAAKDLNIPAGQLQAIAEALRPG